MIRISHAPVAFLAGFRGTVCTWIRESGQGRAEGRESGAEGRAGRAGQSRAAEGRESRESRAGGQRQGRAPKLLAI